MLDILKLQISYTNWKNKLGSKECNGGVKSDDLTNIFRTTLNSHAPLKQKQVRRKQAPFMTKELSKAFMTRSRIMNKCNKWPSRENFLGLKQIKNKCKNLTKTAKKQYFAKSAENQPFGIQYHRFLQIKM